MTYYQFIHAVEEKIKKEVKEERKIKNKRSYEYKK